MARCSILPVAASMHGDDAVAAIVASLTTCVASIDAVWVQDVSEADPALPLLVLVLTGGTEAQVLAADEARARGTAPDRQPLVLVTHPDHNSLPAALEALARVQRDGGSGCIVPVVPGRRAEALEAAVRDLEVRSTLRRMRLGLVGEPSDWLVASVPDAALLAHTWGVTLVDVALGDLVGRLVHDQDVAAAAPMAVPVRLGAHAADGSPPLTELEDAARFEPVLQAAVAAHRLDAVAVRCFDLVTDAHTSGCLALAALNDRGVIAGCEGDVASTVAMAWTRALLGAPGWMANPSVADPVTGVLELAHCTVPLSMVDGYTLQTHFESGLGVGIAGELGPGPVTLVRLGGEGLGRIWCVEGEALATTPRPERCRTQLDVRIAPAEVADLLSHPLGNHVVLVRGHHRARLLRWFESMLPVG